VGLAARRRRAIRPARQGGVNRMTRFGVPRLSARRACSRGRSCVFRSVPCPVLRCRNRDALSGATMPSGPTRHAPLRSARSQSLSSATGPSSRGLRPLRYCPALAWVHQTPRGNGPDRYCFSAGDPGRSRLETTADQGVMYRHFQVGVDQGPTRPVSSNTAHARFRDDGPNGAQCL
jgi:hypothetical protein